MFSNYDKHLQELSFNSSIKTATDEDIFKILRTECCGGKCFRKIEEDISYDKAFDLIKRCSTFFVDTSIEQQVSRLMHMLGNLE